MKENTKKGFKIFRNIVLIILTVLVLVILGAIYFVKTKIDKVNNVEINKEEVGVSEEVEENLQEYRNIAIFGIDSRKTDSYERGNRSDCIIIASLNNKTKEVKLTSVYRDTYLQIDGVGLDKATHAYSYGTEELALKMLNKNLDLNIKEYVTVNFDAVVEAIDLLGGITLNIESDEELNYLNGYIGETSKVTGKSNQKLTHTGRQTVNGVQAVAYSRIRYTSGGDYKRTERMRNVIIAMADKLKTKNIIELNKLIDLVLPKVHTNISQKEIITLIPTVFNMKITESIGWPYDTRGANLGRYYGIPVTLESNVIQLHKDLFDEMEYIPTEQVKEISNKIINKTGYNK